MLKPDLFFLAVEPPVLTPYYSIIFWVMIVMLVAAALIGACDIALQWYIKRQQEKRVQRRSHLESQLKTMFEKGSPFSTENFQKIRLDDFLPTIIGFHDKVDLQKDQSKWEEMFGALEEQYLLPRARKHVKSFRWTQRLKSARCFSLASRPEDEKNILHLIRDRIPIIKHTATQIAGQAATPAAIDAILQEMNNSTHYMRHKFQDALSKGGENTYLYLEKKLEKEEDPYTRVSCLEVLKNRMNSNILHLLKGDLQSDNKNLKIAAIHAVGHFEDAESPSLLTPMLSDPSWEVRAAAARALGYLGAHSAADELVKLCGDSTWWVRLNAALALKRMGAKGKEKLRGIKQEDDRFAYDVAQYALAFDNPLKKTDQSLLQEQNNKPTV